MAGEIILNLGLPEYRDDFCSSSLKEENNELWQQRANKKMLETLTHMGLEARRYKDEQHKKGSQLTSYHHAIFINGDRGAGKTIFLRNAKGVWDKHSRSAVNPPKLHFIDVIDPTLLNIDDRFSEVIIASIFASVECRLNQPEIPQSVKEKFFQSLKTLADALGKSHEIDELRGIDRIQKYRSGIHLERDFHQFLIASVDLLECDALVLPIDDVDMKIDNAFTVLDDIRCLLSCPLILPMVSGDDKLYRYITKQAFIHGPNRKFGVEDDMAEQLSNAYLTKVFPNHIRLPLQPVEQLLTKLQIQYCADDSLSSGGVSTLTFSQYEKLLKDTFYALCNGQERSTSWPRPISAREVTQLIRTLPPAQLQKQQRKKEDIWQKYASWAESHHDGVALTNMESWLSIESAQNVAQLDFSQLSAFNVLFQMNRYGWAEKDFCSQQLSISDEMKAHETNNNILSSIKYKNKILRSMPALEFIMEPMFINKSVANRNGGNPTLVALYTHHNYYSRQLNRRHHIFFSRAFELLGWSLLAVTNNLPEIFYQGDKFKEIFRNLFLRTPFYSIFALNHTREIEEEGDDVILPDNTIDHSEHIEKLVSDLYEWYKSYHFPELKGENLIPLLTAVFNKVFSQLSVLRINLTDKQKARDEDICSLARRFEYIFINALLTFTKEGLVVNTNVATGARSFIVNDYNEFIKYDRTLSRNLNGVLDVTPAGNGEVTITIANDSSYAKLIQAMWYNPIFDIEMTGNYPIGDLKTPEVNKSNPFTKMNFEEIKNFYSQNSGNPKIRIAEVKEWASNNLPVAQNILNALRASSTIDAQTAGTSLEARLFRGLTQACESQEKE